MRNLLRDWRGRGGRRYWQSSVSVCRRRCGAVREGWLGVGLALALRGGVRGPRQGVRDHVVLMRLCNIRLMAMKVCAASAGCLNVLPTNCLGGAATGWSGGEVVPGAREGCGWRACHGKGKGERERR